MNFRLTLILAIVLLGLALGFYLMPAKTEAPAPTETTTPFIATPPNNINTISFINDGKEELRFVRNGQDWRIAVPYDAPALDTVKDLANRLKTLSYRQKFEPAASGFHTADATGTASPTRLLKFTDDATPPHEYTLGFGKETVDGVYTTFNGGKSIHIVDRGILDDISKRPDTFRDKIVAHNDISKAISISIKTSEGVVRLEKKNDKWMIVAPVVARPRQTAVDEILQQMASISANDFTKLTRADVRLDDPVASVTVQYAVDAPPTSAPATQTAGPPTTAATGPAPISVTLDLGVYADLTKKSSVYAAVNGSPSVFTYRSDSFDKLNRTLTNLRDPAVTPAPVANATEFSITTDGAVTVSAVNKVGVWTLTQPIPGLAGDPVAIQDFLGLLRDTMAIRYVDHAGDLPSLGLAPPHRKIDLTLPGETQHEILLVGNPQKDDKGGMVTPMMRQGEDTVYLVQSADADRSVVTPLTLRDKSIERLTSDNIRTITISGPAAGGDKTLQRGVAGWTVSSAGKTGPADEMKISMLLASFTPLSTTKYLEETPAPGTPDITVSLTVHEPAVPIDAPIHPPAISPAPGAVGPTMQSDPPAFLLQRIRQTFSTDQGKDVSRTLRLFKSEVAASAPATAPDTAPATAPATQPTVQWKAVWDTQSPPPPWTFLANSALVDLLAHNNFVLTAPTQPATATAPATAPMMP